MLLTALALSMSLSVGMQKAQADVTVGNWSDLRNAIQNATGIITLDDAINPGLFGNRGSVEVGASNLTIDGQNKELTGTILGLNPAQHIILNSGRTLNITNLTQSQYERFLYNNNGTVNISSESSFSNNDASAITGGEERAGAAIYNAGGIINILDSSFSGNQAYNGGAIANAGGTVVIEKSPFDGNHTTGGNGGAIDTWGGTTTIIDSSFTNNHANDNFDYDAYARGDDSDSAQAGGAINNNNGGTLNIVAQKKDVEFTGNTVGSGNNSFNNAITNNGTINLNASEGHSIIFNDSIGYVRGSSRDGNIININKSDVALTNSAGEAITTPTAGTIAINNAVYDQTVNLYGGTLKFGTSGGFDSTEGHHVNFYIHGGLLDAVNGEADTVTIGWTHAYNDLELALDADAGRNIADYFSTSNHFSAKDGISVNISKVSIINSADDRFVGGAIDTISGTWGLINVKEDTILVDADGNKLEGNTLVSWNKNTGVLKAGKYNLNNAVSDNNTITANGSVVNVELNSDRIYRLVKDEIVSQTLGDMTNGSLTIAGNKHNITANVTNIGGIVIGAGDTVTIKDVLSFNGFNSSNGGALNISGGTTTVSNTNFENNSASQNGGAINITGGTFNMTGGSMSGNEAQNGGAINASGGTVTADGTTFNANSAESGGAIYVSDSAKVTLNNSTISGNIVNSNGGAIYAGGQNASVELNNTIITENIAGEGSAIYNNGSNITLTDTNITENTGASSIYNTGTINILTSEAGKSLTIDNKQSVIKNGNIINLNTVSGSNIIVKDDISGLSAKTDENVVNVNNNTGAAGTVYIGKVSSSTVNISNGMANINGNVDSSNINAGGIQTTISGNVLNSSNVTTTAGATSITGNVTGSKVNTSGGKSTISGDITNNSTISNSGSGTTEITGKIEASKVDVSGGETTIASLTYGSVFEQTNGTATINSIENSTATQSGGTLNLGNTITDAIITAARGTTNLGTTDGNID